MAQPAPQAQDVLDFQFKLQCRLKVFKNESNDEFSRVCSLVATASRYGLVFVGTISKQFQVIRMADIENLEKDVSEYPCRVIEIPSKPTHLSVNCDGTKLCVVVERDECPTAIFYDVLSLLREQVTVIKEIRLSATPNVKVVETEWNPALPNIFTACKSDGLLGVYEFKGTSLDIKELPQGASATCFCWSPKGKQLAVGSLDGKITQFKPDLKVVKVVNPPPLQGSPSIISLKWTSSFQFIGIYKASGQNAQSTMIVIDAPKTGNPVYTNYEDICYSYGDTRPQQFYMILEQHWNVLMVTSSNSMEVGVLANASDKWLQWILGDSSRAELPLSISKQDTLPIGVSLNTGTSRTMGSGSLTPPMLLLMSHYGQLCCFYVLNLKPNAVSVCSPPENVAHNTDNLFKKQTEKQEPSVSSPAPKSLLPTPAPPVAAAVTAPIVTQTQSFFGGTAPSQTSLFSTPPSQKPVSTNLFGMSAPSSQVTSNTQLPTGLFGTNNPPITKPTPQHSKPAVQPVSVVKTPSSTTAVTPLTPEADASKTQTPSKRGQDGRFIVNKETEVMIAKLIHEECLTFEAEFKALLHSCREITVNIGTDNEATQMVQQCNSLQEFLKALKETSSGQTAEIHTLKQTVIQTWAWYEEARSRFNSSQDPALLKVLQGRPLDPASQQQLEDVNHLSYYLDSQLLQANKCLDEQWETFQDSLSKNKKMQVPTMEAIYQSMVKQNATLQKQRYVLKDISSRIRTHRRHQTGNILISLDKVDDLQEELDKLKLYPEECTPQVHYKRILDRQKKLTKEKSEKLFKFFSKRDVTHISVSKPQLNNSTVHLTTLLAAPLSPIAVEKKPLANKLDFVMSTPKPQEKVPLFKDPPKNLTVIFEKSKGICPTSTPLVKPKEAVDKGILKQTDNTGAKPSSTVTFNLNPAAQMEQKSTFNLQQTNTANILFGAAAPSQPKTTSLFAPNNQQSGKGLAFVSANQGTSPSLSTPTTVVSKPTFSFSSLSATLGNDNKVTSMFSKPNTTVSSLFSTAPSGLSITAVPSAQGDAPAAPIFGKSTNNLPNSAFTVTPVSKSATKEANPPASTVAMPLGKVTTPATTSTPGFGIQTAVASSTPFGKTTPSTPADSTTPTQAKLGIGSSPLSTSGGTGSLFGTSTGSIFGLKLTSTGTTLGTPLSTKSLFTSSASTSPFNVTTQAPTLASDASTGSGFFSGLPNSTTTAAGIASTTSTTTVSIVTSTTSTTSVNIVASTVSTTVVTTTTTASTPAAPAASIFGGSLSTAKGSIITGSTTAVTPNTGIFAGQVASTTSSKVASPASGVPTTNSGNGSVNITSTGTAATTGGTGIFGGTSTQNTTSIFAGGTTPLSSSPAVGIFGGASSTTATSNTTVSASGIFVATPSTTGAFGSSSSATTTSGTNIFGGGSTAAPTTTTTTTQSSIFGGVASTPFGATPATTAFGTSTSSGFGAPTTGSSTGSVFGTAQTAAGFGSGNGTSTQSVFGSQSSGFGSTTTTSGFGGSPFTTQTTSAFGSTPPFGGVKPSPFGGFGAAASTSGPVFGQPAAFGNGTSGGSIFGGGASTTASSVFGGATNTFGSNANSTSGGFASASTAASPFRGGGSVFGTTTNTNSPFGVAASSTTSPFAQTASAFGSTPAFGGGFGATGGSFGFNNLNVGNTTTTASSGFGTFGQQSAQNPFGSNNTQNTKSPFSGNSLFATPTTTTAPSVFGGSSPFNKPAAPAFGSPPTFGQAGFGQPAFGQASTFGSPTFGNTTQGAFSSGGQSIQQSGFGSPAFQKPAAAFGSGPVFGSTSPGFGTQSSFGGGPTFGGGGTFGSPQKVFGAQTTESTFGTAPQNPTFGNLANQNTLGFGNLAQQAASPPAPQPTSFSGGSSFSSWR